MVKSRWFIATLLLLTSISVEAQEYLVGLSSGPEVAKAWEMLDKKKSKGPADTINLPFFDDFAQKGVYPDTARWSDNFLFINNSFGIDIITRGVATFDALDQSGSLYVSPTGVSFQADKLTSRYINLAFPASDSIYLSFHYQPQGLGDKPEAADSLTLQFWSPIEDSWFSVWRAEGTALHPFKAVNIRITDPKYLAKGFRFRFVNYASFSANALVPSQISNCDHWNVDYIKLDRNRSAADTLYRDVAFTKPIRSLLYNHEAMPWSQFKKVFLAEMKPTITVNYRNNDAVVRNITRDFVIRDLHKNIIVHSFSGGAVNIDPYSSSTYNANSFYTFATDNPDSALFSITASLKTDPFDPRINDTITYRQVFSDYFAFDDGTAEMGYGVNGSNTQNAMVAYRFKSFEPDSLRAVRIAFNESFEKSNFRSFDLMVWANNNGQPGALIHSDEEVMVEQGPGINGFRQYVLSTPVAVNDIFFVGWKQRSDTYLNAGVDMNTSNNGRHFYWLNGSWNASQITGALMIRAVTGPAITVVSVENEEATPPVRIKLWPNPVNDILNIETDSPYAERVVVVDLSGRIVMERNIDDNMDLSALKPGIYIALIYEKHFLIGTAKFIKAK